MHVLVRTRLASVTVLDVYKKGVISLYHLLSRLSFYPSFSPEDSTLGILTLCNFREMSQGIFGSDKCTCFLFRDWLELRWNHDSGSLVTSLRHSGP